MSIMENRFRNFLNTRRARSTEAEAPTDALSLPYSSSPSPTQQSTFLFRPRGRNQAETRKPGPNATMPLRSFSYESCQPGKSPTFGALPQKGNGPIKLQTSRRLSSGELIILPQDSHQTLEDIREDGYIVGKKDKQSTSRLTQHSTISAIRPRLSHASYSAPSLQVPFSETWSQSAKSSDEDLRSSVQQTVGLGVSQHAPPSRTSRTYDSISEYRTFSRNNSVSVESTRSSMRQSHDSNATLKALRKAEYAKLVELYGSDTAARSFAHYDAHQNDTSFNSVKDGPPTFSPVVLEPLPLPPIDTENRRSSRSSSISESLYSSSSSPQRASYVSSIATGQTSIEEDSAATREDIRKMVEQMRNSYLSAIESREPTPSKTRIRKSRKSKHNSTTSPTFGPGQSRASVASSTQLLRNNGRQTWHPADTDRDMHSQRRVNSHPPSGFGRLSPIEASPPRSLDGESGLKRADSGTLGALMAEVTRLQLRSKSSAMSKTNAQEPESTTKPQTSRETESWLDIDSDPSDEARTESPTHIAESTDHQKAHTKKDSEDFDQLFADELWSDSTATSMFRPLSMCTTYSKETYPTTPKKKISHITSIPESPEYTHLATTNDPENNFI